MPTQDEDRRAELLGYFYEESAEGLELMEAGLLNLEIDDIDPEEINGIFRAIHSIKGSGGSFGLEDISKFAHIAETLLDEIRNADRQLTAEGVELLLRATDCLTEMIRAKQQNTDVDQDRIDEVARDLQAMLDDGQSATLGSKNTPPIATESEPAAVAASDGVTTWQIHFAPHRQLLRTGNEPLRIFRELASHGDLEVTVDLAELPTLGDMDAEDCYLKWDLELRTDASEETLRDAFSWVDDECDLELTRCEAAPDTDPSENVATGAGSPKTPKKGTAKEQSGTQASRAGGSIRVSTEKIDALVNMVGELVITQAMLGEVGENFDENRLGFLRDGLAQLERNTRELQDSVMRIRMLPVSVTFNRFPRLVHDLSQKLGKEVELVLAGEGTELDKTVLEKIADPLVHLIRNSLDHGLETPDVRLAAGKPRGGTINLEAFHQGGNIVIEVSDDGAGLNPDRIRAKAIAAGMISEGDQLGDSQLFELLFQAGFSTATEVSDVSGRGVGLDVVRRNIRELGGSIEIQSTVGVGSTFTIRLPLTLAILDGQLVRVGRETYIVPLISIVESLQIKAEFVNVIAGRAETYRLRDEAIPIVRLYGLFGVAPDKKELDKGLLVVVEGGGKKAAVLVDDLLGQQQVVIKSLKENFGDVPGLSGATILGDGTVALIVDIVGLIDLARTGIFVDLDVQGSPSDSGDDGSGDDGPGDGGDNDPTPESGSGTDTVASIAKSEIPSGDEESKSLPGANDHELSTQDDIASVDADSYSQQRTEMKIPISAETVAPPIESGVQGESP